MKSFLSVCVFAIFLISCSDSKADPGEEGRVATMDSTTKLLQDKNEKLEEQTKKVEASLEKLDGEFDTKDTNN